MWIEKTDQFMRYYLSGEKIPHRSLAFVCILETEVLTPFVLDYIFKGICTAKKTRNSVSFMAKGTPTYYPL